MNTVVEDKERVTEDAKWRTLDADTRAYLTKLNNRTPEEIEAARALSTRGYIPRPLPPGKTLEDVIVGALPDDEDDAAIIAALQDMG